jgi:DNA-binding CsgD family transcriptional regulator
MSRIRSDWLDAAVSLSESATLRPRQIAELIVSTIPCDQVLYTHLDYEHGHANVSDELHDHKIVGADLLLTVRGSHPAVNSFVVDPTDITPRRISDTISQFDWEHSPAYNDVFRPYKARFQLSIVTSLDPPHSGRGWALTRTLSDFTDDDVETARYLLPAIAIATRRMVAIGPIADEKPVLTDRERAILSRIAEGWTARHIAYELAISEGTVRKHLQNAYRKLGSSDRLMATRRAAALDLI